MDEKDVISRIRENDRTALKALYAQMHDPVVMYLMARGATKEDALDTFQDAMVLFYRNVQSNKFDAEYSKILTYVHAIARNLWVHKLRKQSRSILEPRLESSHLFEVETSQDPESIYIKKEISDEVSVKLEQALSKMSDKCRTLITMYYLQNKSSEQIADELGLSNLNVAKVMKHRCLRQLREIFKEEERSNQNAK